MKSIKEVLKERDDVSEQEADDLINEARDQMHSYLEQGHIDLAYNICEEYFRLEPDYLTQLV